MIDFQIDTKGTQHYLSNTWAGMEHISIIVIKQDTTIDGEYVLQL